MAELKFSCQGCGQHIQCDEQWSGRQISCPACGADLTVPPGAAPVAQETATAPPTAAPAAPARRLVPKKKPFPVKRLLLWCAGTAVFVVAIFFLLREADVWQGAFNSKQKEMVANSSGGELTHIAKVYQVLDETDPAKREAAQMKANQRAERERNQMIEGLKIQPDPSLALPLTAPTYTLDGATAAIPNARVNGLSAGAAFKVETNHLDATGMGGVLAFQEGVGTEADHELFIYLDANDVTRLANRSWTVNADTRGKDVPQVVKRWTINPKFAPVPKTFGSGYVLRLEFGQATRDWQPGRIYLALPDPGHTVLAGNFSLPMPRSADDDKELEMLQGMRR